MLKALLNKGGAGKSITRPETVDRLSDLLKQYNVVMYTYHAAQDVVQDEEQASAVEALAHEVRNDLGKLSEIILSNGGVPPLGTDMEPEGIAVGESAEEALASLAQEEQRLLDALGGESRVRHMLRTRATLDTTESATRERVQRLKQL